MAKVSAIDDQTRAPTQSVQDVDDIYGLEVGMRAPGWSYVDFSVTTEYQRALQRWPLLRERLGGRDREPTR